MNNYTETSSYIKCRECNYEIGECDFCGRDFENDEIIYCNNVHNHLCVSCYNEEMSNREVLK